MRSQHWAPALGLLAVLAVFVAVPAGGSDDEQDVVRRALEKGELLPLTKILEIASARVAGDVVKIELERDDGAIIYEIKVLTGSGRVRELELDARTGEVLKIEDD